MVLVISGLTGVRTGSSFVNSVSKFVASFRFFCKAKSQQLFIYCEAETYKFWLEGGFHFSFFKLLPFDVPEERMVLDCILSSMGLDGGYQLLTLHLDSSK